MLKNKMSVKKNIIGTTFNCPCGNVHSIPTKHFIYAPDVIDKIPEILSLELNGRTVNLIADKNTYLAAGKSVEKKLENSGWNVQLTIIPDNENYKPVCDDITFANLNKILKNADVFLAV